VLIEEREMVEMIEFLVAAVVPTGMFLMVAGVIPAPLEV
jgi:hypothetical protein